MSIKKILLGMTACLTISSTALAVPFPYDYTVQGKVIGVVSQQSQNNSTPCYIAIKSSSTTNAYYSGKYHAMKSLDQCQASRLAYALGLDAKIWGRVTDGKDTSNDVSALEIHHGEVSWWK